MQGNNLSPTIFGIYINSLLTELKPSGIGVKVYEGEIINVLAYADDIVLLADKESDLQKLLVIVEEWCNKW